MPKQRSNLDVAEPLKYWRTKRGYSQSWLAKQADTSALTISQLETGKRKARGKTLDKILSGLKTSREEFFSMRELPHGAGAIEAAAAAPISGTGFDSKSAGTGREAVSIRLSNLDLELLNRILNLDFEGKLEALKFLQGLRNS